MVNWYTYNNPVVEYRKIPFTSNLLSMWNAKLKNIHENKRSRQSIYKNPSIATTTTLLSMWNAKLKNIHENKRSRQSIYKNPSIATTTTTKTTPTAPIVSTRDHFSLLTGKLNPLHDIIDYDCYHVPKFNRDSYLYDDLVIYIHGVWTKQASANEQIDRTKLSLNVNKYYNPIIGFSWDSNTAINPSGWNIAKFIANQNGPKLAKFISDFKTNCPNVNIRIIAHSLGAKVVESALIALANDTNQIWMKDTVYNIASVHLIGAAINDESTSKNTPFGNAIENTVNTFYNLYNSEDTALKGTYVNTENQNPLGLYGLKKGEPLPANYTERDVKFEIPPLKMANGIYQSFWDKEVSGWGDNHSGYIGFREHYPFSRLLKDDGAINLIVEDWRNDNNRN
jgi:esterase/lipase superfamily enzyme